MKKVLSVLFVAICCVAMAMPAQAQVKFGIKGGINLTNFELKETPLGNIKENSTGFFIGPMIEATVPIIGIGVDGAVMFSQRGKNEYKQQGLEIPINLKYTFGLGDMAGIYLAVGPDFFFNFKDIDLKNLDGTKKSANVGLNLGAGVKLVNHLQIGVNYQIGLGDSFNIKNAGKSLKNKTNVWQVSLAYMF